MFKEVSAIATAVPDSLKGDIKDFTENENGEPIRIIRSSYPLVTELPLNSNSMKIVELPKPFGHENGFYYYKIPLMTTHFAMELAESNGNIVYSNPRKKLEQLKNENPQIDAGYFEPEKWSAVADVKRGEKLVPIIASDRNAA